MNNLMDVGSTQGEQTMTSREVAELTGKLHKHVMRDCRKHIHELITTSSYLSGNGEQRPQFIVEPQGVDILLSRYNSVKGDFKGRAVVRHEYIFGEDIVSKLFNGYEVMPQFKVLGYRLDWYIPELKLAIEFDEPQHFVGGRLKDECIDRQKEIEKLLGCKFLRFKQ